MGVIQLLMVGRAVSGMTHISRFIPKVKGRLRRARARRGVL